MLKHITWLLSFLWIGIGSANIRNIPPAVPPITIEMQRVPLLAILTEIEKQAGIVFSYESALLDNLPLLSFSAKEEALSYCLKRLFANLPIVYKETGNYVILRSKPQVYTISGFIRDKESQECLLNASIYDLLSHKGSNSNNYGFFSITLPRGNVRLRTSYVGFKTKEFFLDLQSDTLLQLELTPLDALNEVVIEGNNIRSEVHNSRTSALELSSEALQSAPALFGEADVVRTFQQTPGVAIGTEGLTGMYVRGGNNDENLFLIDGNPVYHINHLVGLFSTFNPDAIKNATFYKGSFPARYGGRLSSIMDIRQKEGDMQAYHGNISIGLLAAKANIEGPIVKNRTSFNVSFRRTYLDAITSLAQAIYNKKHKDDQAMIGYSFYDLNAKISHKFSDVSRLYLSFYTGQDRLRDMDKAGSESVNEDMRWRWGNMVGSANWMYVFNNKLFGNMILSYSRYRSKLRQEEKFYQFLNDSPDDRQYTGYSKELFSSSIEDAGFRTDFDYMPRTNHLVKFGTEYIFHIYHPEVHKKTIEYLLDKMSSQQQNIYKKTQVLGHETAAYLEDEWKISSQWKANAGVRFSLFSTPDKVYTSLDPRLSLRYLIKKNLSVKTAYAKMTQYIHLLSNSYLTLPSDIWVPVTSRIPPMTSHQITTGIYYNLHKLLAFSIEGYYKTMNNQIEYQDAVSIFPSFSRWDEKISVGKGRAYGMEVMTRKQSGSTTGWVSYTLSWADRIFPDGSVNNGKRFPAKYDNRHKFNITLNQKISKKVELCASWMYATGNRMSVAVGQYLTPNQHNQYPRDLSDEAWSGYNPNNNFPFYTETTTDIIARNAVKLGAYHRLDLSLNVYRLKKKGRLGIWNISIYNAYCRMNPFSSGGVIYKKDNKYYMEQHGYVPIILSVSYTYKF